MMNAKLKKTFGLGFVLVAALLVVISASAAAGARSPADPAPAIRAEAGAPQPAAPQSAAPAPGEQELLPTINLCASTGTLTLADGTVVPIWGFSLNDGSCGPGDAQLPGPVIDVPVGSSVQVNLENQLSENVSVVFPGQSMLPDMDGAAPGGTTSYSFIASDPGTYMYEAGTNPGIQVAMGMYGALVVRPAVLGQAYDHSSSSFDVENILVLSEIDPALNASPGSFNLLDYAPQYWLINGQSYPDTAGTVIASPGDRLLLRYINAGMVHHTMSVLGLYQTVIGKDAFFLNFSAQSLAETVPSGSSADVIVTIPPGASLSDEFPLYSRNWRVTNGDITSSLHAPGGMLTFIEVN